MYPICQDLTENLSRVTSNIFLLFIVQYSLQKEEVWSFFMCFRREIKVALLQLWIPGMFQQPSD